ncbi:unnamed protein product [Schistosoma rodhaini]|uniref:Uncharacterized protein n=1 Tax=Schistosoma rodhaini TaxID=6188 RepID=A0AA85FEZ5_9TREM|nr:unnamed protein product [Schistosoma rodhaini]
MSLKGAETSSNQYFQFPSVIIPTTNYFPCSTTTTNNNNNNTTQYSYMKLPIHWPTYYIIHKPNAPEDVTGTSSIQSQLSSRIIKKKRSIIYYSLKQSNNNTDTLKQLYTFSKLYPIACLQLKIQFLSNDNNNRLSSQVILSLGSNKQTIRNVFTIDESFRNAYYEDYNDDRKENVETSSSLSTTSSRIDWSILRQEISDLVNNTLPYDVWINVSMPIYPTTDLNTPPPLYNQTNHYYNQYMEDNNVETSQNFHDTLIEQSDHWVAMDTTQFLSIFTTNNVCIDDITLYTHQNRQLLKSKCQSKLIWISNNKKQSNHSIQSLHLNTYGYPILLNRTSSTSSTSDPLNTENNKSILKSFHSFYSNKYSLYNHLHIIWITGSLLLAIFITFLAILFIITFSLSVMCNQRKNIHLNNLTTDNNLSSQNEKCKKELHNRRKLYSNHHHQHDHHNKDHCDNELLRILPEDIPNSSFLIDLHNHLSSSSLHGLLHHHHQSDSQQCNSQQAITNTLTNQQQFLDDNSTELSLCMQDDKNELLHSIDRQNIDHSDVSATSAIQLLRNWKFYKQRSTTPSNSYYYPPPGSSSFHNNPNYGIKHNPTKQLGVKHNPSNTSMLLYMDHHPLFSKGYTTSSSNVASGNPTTSNFNDKCQESRISSSHLKRMPEVRQSLILSVNDNNELIILPSSTTTTTMNHNEQQNGSIENNNTLGMLNSLSEEDAEATRLEMAASVGALDNQYSPNDNTLDHIDYTLSSTIPRSLIINGEQPPPSYNSSS